MTTTWSTLLNGLVGNVIATLAAIGAALLAIWWDRGRWRQELNRREAQREAERKRRAVGRVSLLLTSWEAEIRWSPFMLGRTTVALTQAVVDFEAEVGAEHPAVAAWLLERHTEITGLLAAWRKWWWTAGLNRKRSRAVGDALTRTATTLTLWSTGRIGEADVLGMTLGSPAGTKKSS